MPELPEVETVVRELAPLVTGARVRGLDIFDTARLPVVQPGRLRGRLALEPVRIGKQVVLPLDGGLWLSVHLRMTGRLTFVASSRVRDRRHLRARLKLDRGAVLFYDVRRFGTIALVSDEAALRSGGVDPIQDRFTPAVLRSLLGDRTRQPLKAWLLRQDRVVGIGNIYASEILYRARLDPHRAAGSLDAKERARLHRAIRGVLEAAIAHRGTTFSDFESTDGRPGGHQRYLGVFLREGEPCGRCRTSIMRIAQQGRSTFYCPSCQPPRG